MVAVAIAAVGEATLDKLVAACIAASVVVLAAVVDTNKGLL